MHKKCSKCRLVNYPDAEKCARCEGELTWTAKAVASQDRRRHGFLIRSLVCFLVCVSVLVGFYVSLIASAKPLNIEQKYMVRQAVRLLREKGFKKEAFLLDDLTVFRADDNWLNASVAKENAYAATNFPFEIITLYSDFFTYPLDDVERAAILLHESKHLEGKDETEAYEFVWKNRRALGWTRERYSTSTVWTNTRRLTRENSPKLFICDLNEFSDCTELEPMAVLQRDTRSPF